MNRLGWVLVVVVVVAAVAVMYLTKEATHFAPDFHFNSKKPYGSKAFVEWLRSEQHRQVQITQCRLADLLDSTSGAVTVLIAAEWFSLDEESSDAVDTLLDRGSTIVIAAAGIDNDFLAPYQLRTESMYVDAMPLQDPRRDEVAITDSSLAPGISYALQQVNAEDNTTATSTDTSTQSPSNWKTVLTSAGPHTHVLAVRAQVGNGTLVICTTPQLFTNYGMLYDRIWNATSVLVEYMPPGPVVWDEHYKPRNAEQRPSRLTLISQYPGLTLAYWLLLGGLGTYLVVAGRRRQRAIPTHTSDKNHTLEFLSNITALYWLRRDNTAVVERMMLQFRKYVVLRLRLNFKGSATNIAQSIAASTGAPIDVVQRLVALCQSPLPPTISDEQLLSIGADTSTFYNAGS